MSALKMRYLSKSFSVFDVRKFIITSSSSFQRGKVRQLQAFSHVISPLMQETGASEPSAAVMISATV